MSNTRYSEIKKLQKNFTVLIFSVFLSFIIGCNSETNTSNRVVIGTSSDIESLNPLYTYSYLEGSINNLLYSSLVQHNWDKESNRIVTYPLLAKEWEWNSDKTELKISLRKDIYWSDSTKITVDDFIFSYELYSNPDVQSRFFGSFNSYYSTENGKIDIEKSFSKFSDEVLIIKFKNESTPTLYDIDLPLLPSHYLRKLSIEKIKGMTFSDSLITSGPLILQEWKKTQFVRLKKNPISVITSDKMPDEYIFKIVPNYNSMLLQLSKGEIDFLEEIKPADKESLIKEEHLSISSVEGREYDFVGWNNINPKNLIEKGSLTAHPLFGNAEVRKALTQAIDRKTILAEFLLDNGQLADGPISPIFKEFYHSKLKKHAYNPANAKNILSQHGWQDTNGDGIIDKEGIEFKFTLIYPSGNPRRKFASTLLKKNLADIGIDAEIQSLDRNQFGQKIFTGDFDACMLGWLVPLPIDLFPFWHSNKNYAQANFVSFNNSEVDSLLERNTKKISDLEYVFNTTEIQEILAAEQPVSFLYWIDNIVAYNKRLNNVNISPMGALNNIWEWEL